MDIITRRRFSLTALVCFTLFLVAGCSGVKTYPNSYKKNLHIQTATSSESKLARTKVALDIYKVLTGCNKEYLGTVRLDKSVTEVGIPVGQASYLVFNFNSSAMFSNTTSSIAQPTVLMPKKGRRYRIKATYQDDIYNVAIKEYRPGKKGARNIALSSLRGC